MKTLSVCGFVNGVRCHFFFLADAAAAGATGVYVLGTPVPAVIDGVCQWYTSGGQ